MSTRSKKVGREVDVSQFLDENGLIFLWNLIKQGFVAIVPGKGLSTNDFTDALKQKLEEMTPGGGTADAVAWENITGKPELPTLEEVTSLITTQLSDYPTTEQMNNAIDTKVVGVYRYMGSVPTFSNLPTSGLTNGDVYDVEDTGMNYGWVQPESGGQGYWDPLGQVFHIESIPNNVIQEIVEGTYGT